MVAQRRALEGIQHVDRAKLRYSTVWGALGEEVQYQDFTVQRSLAARGFQKCSTRGSAIVQITNGLKSNQRDSNRLESVVQDGFQWVT
jgi:hypothetical protein